jgi:DNA-binding CsgD family transcriptional regulator
MKKANYARTVYTLVPDGALTHSTISALEDVLDNELPKLRSSQFNQTLNDKHIIWLINFYDAPTVLDEIKRYGQSVNELETMIYDVPRALRTDELVKFGHLKALFLAGTSAQEIAQGINEVINGQNWLPRRIMSQLINYYRYLYRNHNQQAIVELTAREIQILRSLESGTSNAQLAEDLFISEFTVKSHLYQIFKKISVRNRTQAIAWARQNIVS